MNIPTTHSLEEIVRVITARPDDPDARKEAVRLVLILDQFVDLGRITLDTRHRYYQLLAPVLYPAPAPG